MNDPTQETQSPEVSPEVLEHLKAMGIAYVPPATARQSQYQPSPWTQREIGATGMEYVPPAAPAPRRSLDPGFDAPPSNMPRDPYFEISATPLPPNSKLPEFEAPPWWDDVVQQAPPTVAHPRAYVQPVPPPPRMRGYNPYKPQPK